MRLELVADLACLLIKILMLKSYRILFEWIYYECVMC